MKIVLDAMSGDNAPLEIVKGGIEAVLEYDCEVILAGDEQKINEILKECGQIDNSKISVVATNSVVDMCDEPNIVVREKRDSSMGVALDMLARGEADALVSAGNTGALLAGGTLIVKRIKGIRRAVLAATVPNAIKGGSIIVDSGANVECTADYLEQFAIMGNVYCKKALKKENPRIGLVNNGSEESKGSPMVKETYKLLEENAKKGRLNFIGNIEGRDVALGTADVIVTDGFTGNVLLKTYEGVGMYLSKEIKNMFMQNIFTKISAVFVNKGLNKLKKDMDYKETGGAPLLGIQKAIVKAHGSSDAYAIRSACRQVIAYKKSGTIEAITDEVAQK